jgi:hypothetical protein
MNLDLARKILAVTEAQPFGFIKLRASRIAYDVEEMRAAGLVEVSAAPNDHPDVAVIKCITEAGRKFLRIVDDRATAGIVERAFSFSKLNAPDLEVTLL